ncbi:MAG: hypothetical protein IPN76_24785 [Saprospiraceae bacterium]|nr:hypothetical protein [Saprospiraceae bacterium]
METIGKSFVLKNIDIVQKGQIFPMAISVYNGLWIGFEFGKDVAGFDNFQVGLSNLTKERMPGSLEIERLTQGLSSEKLDLLSLGEIEVDGMHYFQIKDLGDGNYIGIDEKGTVYGLLHDPFKIEKISDSFKQFVQDVNKGRFDFEQYLEGKNGYTN